MDSRILTACFKEQAELLKLADLSPEHRAELPNKDFAVPDKKSNTGAEAYPIDTKRRAAVALGLSKMHGDQADIVAVRKKVEAKYPGMVHEKSAGLLQSIGSKLAPLAGEAAGHKTELAGLGLLAAPSIDQLQAHGRAALSGNYNKEEVKKREFLPAVAHPLAETAGLGILAGPSLAHLARH